MLFHYLNKYSTLILCYHFVVQNNSSQFQLFILVLAIMVCFPNLKILLALLVKEQQSLIQPLGTASTALKLILARILFGPDHYRSLAHPPTAYRSLNPQLILHPKPKPDFLSVSQVVLPFCLKHLNISFTPDGASKSLVSSSIFSRNHMIHLRSLASCLWDMPPFILELYTCNSLCLGSSLCDIILSNRPPLVVFL